MAKAWADHYRELLADIIGRAAAKHAYPPELVEAAEGRLGGRLPAPLREYYLSVGRHPINRAHNRLWPPESLEVTNGRLAFMEENQCVVFWGVPARSRAADPSVFQTEDLEDGDWYPEARCSVFLSAMLCWQAVGGGLPHTGHANPVPWAVARRAVKGWRFAGRVGDLFAFARAGQVVCALRDGEAALLHLATRGRRDLGSLAAELGVVVSEV